MANSKSDSEINDKKRKELISFLKDNINSRSTLTTHRELSVWAALVLYLTFIMILIKLYFDKLFIFQNVDFKIILSFFLGFVLIAVLALIHAQNGAHVSARSLSIICGKYIFKLITGDEEPDGDKWKSIDNGYLPNFIKKEINDINKKNHKFLLVGPWIIFIWLILKVLKTISSNKIKVKEFEKMQLIESSIYCIIIIPTIFFYILIWPDLPHDIIKFISDKLISF